MIDWHSIADAIGGAFLLIFGWALSVIHTDNKATRDALDDHIKSLPATYARRDDVSEMKDEILSAIRELRIDLKSKADK